MLKTSIRILITSRFSNIKVQQIKIKKQKLNVLVWVQKTESFENPEKYYL